MDENTRHEGPAKEPHLGEYEGQATGRRVATLRHGTDQERSSDAQFAQGQRRSLEGSCSGLLLINGQVISHMGKQAQI